MKEEKSKEEKYIIYYLFCRSGPDTREEKLTVRIVILVSKVKFTSLDWVSMDTRRITAYVLVTFSSSFRSRC